MIPLKTKYPQIAEKMLIEAVLQKQVPSGKLPIDVHVVVNNVGTIAGIGGCLNSGNRSSDSCNGDRTRASSALQT
ncbi:MAG: hypothetical protein R3C26_13770 [Calditrichia bacterium]